MLTGDLHDAEDVFQEVSTQYLRSGPPPETDHARRWLFTASRNRALNVMRGKARRRRRESAYAEDGPASRHPDPPDPADAAVQGEEHARIKDCLMKLPPEMREMLFLKIVEGVSYSGLADRFGIARSTVVGRVSNGLVQLNRCFHGGAI